MSGRVLAVVLLVASQASAQPTFGIGVGSTGCADVARQIVRDWFDVRELLSGDAKATRPAAGDLQCVDPAYLRGAMAWHGGITNLKCFEVDGRGVCCDAQMQECATR